MLSLIEKATELYEFDSNDCELIVLGEGEEAIKAVLTSTGLFKYFECQDILISRTCGNNYEGGLARIYLRVIHGDETSLLPLLGPEARPKEIRLNSPESITWVFGFDNLDLDALLTLTLSGNSYSWDISATNLGDSAIALEVIYGQDIGLANHVNLQNNEAYVSQYVDQTVVEDQQYGYTLIYRQNLSQKSQTSTQNIHPWIMVSSPQSATSYSTDGYDFFGAENRVTGSPAALREGALRNKKKQFEFNYAALTSKIRSLNRGDCANFSFRGDFLFSHPEPSNKEDVLVAKNPTSRGQQKENYKTIEPQFSFFAKAGLLECRSASKSDIDELYPQDRIHLEELNGSILSFFTSDKHIVTKEKELIVDRPHGTILIGNKGFSWSSKTPATTVYMAGVFSAQLTAGNTSFHKFNSQPRDPLNVSHANSLRIFIESNGSWLRLGTPSIFEMSRDSARWLYLTDDGLIEVTTRSIRSSGAIEIAVRCDGKPKGFIITNELVMGSSEYNTRVHVSRPPQCNEFQFESQSANLQFSLAFSQNTRVSLIPNLLTPFTQQETKPYGNAIGFEVSSTNHFSLQVEGTTLSSSLTEKSDDATEPRDYWEQLTRNFSIRHHNGDIAKLNTGLAWFAHNAMIHYASPHGLEQYSGAAWGTRDVCQGPFEFFLAHSQDRVNRDILLRTYSAQYKHTGAWPQWFMLDEYRDIAQEHSHGDIVIWPLRALAMYLEATGDETILHEEVPYATKSNASSPVRESFENHVSRALDNIESEMIPGTGLIRYGDGDWDDSLQPAKPSLRSNLVSSWTVALLAQTMEDLGQIPSLPHHTRTRALDLAKRARTGFRERLIHNGTVCGFYYFNESSPEESHPLIHPDFSKDGPALRLIPITRSIIAGILSKEQAHQHLELIKEKLLFPDGVRLMDKPAEYRGGLERTFRRAESAANFGREIGLQYVHAHIRYAEALSVVGNADELLKALLMVNPVKLDEAVPNARPRQSNMYFSSSDADFSDRYEASKLFNRLKEGAIAVKEGWRLYSSGPGIYTGVVIRNFLGLRRSANSWIFDPVLPSELDGLELNWELENRPTKIVFHIKNSHYSPSKIELNRYELKGSQTKNPYRKGGLQIERDSIRNRLNKSENTLEIFL